MGEEKKLYSTPEAAELLGVSASHMRNMVRTGQAKPSHRVGQNWVFTIDEIERLRNRPKGKGGRPKRE